MIHEQITLEVIERLKKAGFQVEGYNKSEGEHGQSHYIFAMVGENMFKFRVSDHSVTNTYRMANEFCIYTNALSVAGMGSVIEKAERVAFPERFEVVFTGQIIKGIHVRQYIRK